MGVSHRVRLILLSMTTWCLLVGRRIAAVINLLLYTFLTNLPRSSVATCQWPVCLIPLDTSAHKWPSFCRTDKDTLVTTLFANHIQVRFLQPPDELVSFDSTRVYLCWSRLLAAVEKVSFLAFPCISFHCKPIIPCLCRRFLF